MQPKLGVGLLVGSFLVAMGYVGGLGAQFRKMDSRKWVLFSRFGVKKHASLRIRISHETPSGTTKHAWCSCTQYTAPRTCHTRKFFLACGSSGAHASQLASFCFVVFHKNSHGLTAFLFLLLTALHPFFILRMGVFTAIRNMAFGLAVLPNRAPLQFKACVFFGIWSLLEEKCTSQKCISCFKKWVPSFVHCVFYHCRTFIKTT